MTAYGKPYRLRTGGVGGTINTTDAFNLLNVAIKVANKTFTIPGINVRTTQVGRNRIFSTVIWGSLLLQRKKMKLSLMAITISIGFVQRKSYSIFFR
ncbi:hypothetical protein [Niastella koreensis]|uniref:hypothetical protein n=1 Tax=Niastella koreensis TaxID=354356 RepID=UPI0002F4AD0F|nr:hypothetical protein [Niastella koreensis]